MQAQEYTITKISEQDPRQWTGEHGTVYYIKCMLDGWNKPVTIGKKDPNALSVGEKVYGTIKTTDFPEDSFKSEKKPFEGGGYGKRDDASIKAQFAIKAAIATGWAKETTDLEELAKELFDMVEKVKSHKPSLKDQWDNQPAVKAKQAEEKKEEAKKPAFVPDEVDYDIGDEPINLDGIPF